MYSVPYSVVYGVPYSVPYSVVYGVPYSVVYDDVPYTLQISRNVAPTCTRGFACGLIIAQKRAWHLFRLRISQSTLSDVHS